MTNPVDEGVRHVPCSPAPLQISIGRTGGAQFEPAFRQTRPQLHGFFQERFPLRRLSLLAQQPAELQAGVKIIWHQFAYLPISRDGTLWIFDDLKKIGQAFIKVNVHRGLPYGISESLAHALAGIGLGFLPGEACILRRAPFAAVQRC